MRDGGNGSLGQPPAAGDAVNLVQSDAANRVVTLNTFPLGSALHPQLVIDADVRITPESTGLALAGFAGVSLLTRQRRQRPTAKND